MSSTEFFCTVNSSPALPIKGRELKSRCRDVVSNHFLALMSLLFSCFLLLNSVSTAQDKPAADASSIRNMAVVDFSFDGTGAAVSDLAKSGMKSDDGKLVNDPVRLPSPFWNQSGKMGLRLNEAKQQYIEVADSPDVDAPTGVTFHLLVVNLADPADSPYRGLVAKRGTSDNKVFTNYGVNFSMQADNLQIYLSDGSGFKVVQYSSKDTLSFRKRISFAATYELADAPQDKDADTDVDDVRIVLYINGEPVTPKSVSNGFVSQTDAWITDVTPAGLVNDFPLTIGRSDTTGEYLSAIIDEFSLFPKPLSRDEVKKLFTEVAGNDVQAQIAADKPEAAPVPSIDNVSQTGVTI
ncbi:MAG: LamG domain-containing protein, partial [Planctomycetes bacterium]|nr:LamG domain-containing protein [Planctomycetota bacterium]